MPENPATPRVVRFGAFEVDLRTRELRKHGLKIKLQEKPYQVLAALLRNPGELVTREELRRELWPADTFVDFDTSLNAAVNKLREALGDSAESSRYIETLPRLGYRFMAAVDGTRVSPAVSPEPAFQEPVETRGVAAKWSRRRKLFVAGLGMLAIVAVVAGVRVPGWHVRWLGRADTARIQSIAVLPLDNLTGDPAQEYFADAMTDALTTQLAQISSLRVISRMSVLKYKKEKKPVPEIGRELNVDAVVEGAVARSGDKVRITAQLVHAATDRHLWAKGYERDLRDVLALQDEVARAIASEVRVKVTPQEQVRLARARPINPEAYDYYFRAKYYVGPFNKPYTENAIQMLERAVAIDPTFALAYSALADAYIIKASTYQPEEKQWEQKALTAIERALSLDPDLAEVYYDRAFLLWTPAHRFPHEQVVRELRHALALNPNLDEAHQLLSSVYNHIGLLHKGLEEAQKAVAINPANTGARYRAGINLLFQGEYEKGLAALADSKEFFPALWAYQTSWALFHLGRREEAASRIAEFAKKYPEDEGGILASMQAMLAAAAGKDRLAEEKIRVAVGKGRGYTHFHHTAYGIASAYALMNKPEPALKYLRMAAEDGFPCYPLFARDASLDNLRNHPRFIAFMAQLKKQWEHYQATL